MRTTISDFNQSDACKQFFLFLDKRFTRNMDCKKIVAIGGATLGPARPKNNKHMAPLAAAVQTQHAALLAIRRKLKLIYHKAGDMPIFLQDPLYNEEDKKAAAQLGMTVVNASTGFQEGWVLLDEETLVVDFNCSLEPRKQLIFEITRPLAIISVGRYETHPAEDENWAPYAWHLRANDREIEWEPSLKDWSDVVPGYGM